MDALASPIIRVFTRYIAREFAFTFLIAILFLIAVFFVTELLSLGERLLESRVSARNATRLMIYSFPLILSWAIPFGILLASLITLGGLGSNLELLAMQACGHSLTRIFMPLIVTGLVVTAISFVVSDVLLPASNIAFNRLYRQLLFGNVSIALQPNSTKLVENTVIVTGDRDADRLQNVVIIDRTDQLDRRVIVAQKLLLSDLHRRADVVTLTLEDVLVHTVNSDTDGSYDYSHARTMDYNVLLRDMTDGHTPLSPFEQNSIDLWHTITEKYARLRRDQLRLDTNLNLSQYRLVFEIDIAEHRILRASIAERAAVLQRERERLHEELLYALASSDAPVDDYYVRNDVFEFHKRFAIAFASLVFALLACRASVVVPRGGRVFALLTGVAVATMYWLLLVGAQRIALYSTSAPPALMAWGPNVVVIFLTLFSFLSRPVRWIKLQASKARGFGRDTYTDEA